MSNWKTAVAFIAVISSAAWIWSLSSGATTSGPATAPTTTTAPAEWLTSLADAVKLAQAGDKPILANFTGSDWCPFCKRLQAEVFNTQEFQGWAAKNVILLELDFPSAKPQDDATRKQNADMAKTYKVEAYPTVIFLDAAGVAAGKLDGYVPGTGAKAWIASADAIIHKPAK
jgi:protein disulfide-isomerase